MVRCGGKKWSSASSTTSEGAGDVFEEQTVAACWATLAPVLSKAPWNWCSQRQVWGGLSLPRCCPACAWHRKVLACLLWPSQMVFPSPAGTELSLHLLWGWWTPCLSATFTDEVRRSSSPEAMTATCKIKASRRLEVAQHPQAFWYTTYTCQRSKATGSFGEVSLVYIYGSAQRFSVYSRLHRWKTCNF